MRKTIRNLSLILCLIFTIVPTGSTDSSDQENIGNADDTAITANVKSKLLNDSSLKGLTIKVETSKGVVQLSGLVDTKEQARKVEEIAKSVEGVKKVKNGIITKDIY